MLYNFDQRFIFFRLYFQVFQLFCPYNTIQMFHALFHGLDESNLYGINFSRMPDFTAFEAVSWVMYASIRTTFASRSFLLTIFKILLKILLRFRNNSLGICTVLSVQLECFGNFPSLYNAKGVFLIRFICLFA